MAQRALDLADIQGNILRPYGRFGFPVMRHFFFNFGNPAAGRAFVGQVREAVTTAERWGAIDGDPTPNAPPRPLVAVNIGFSFMGLLALALPTQTLSRLPDEFIDGMSRRRSILGDVGSSAPDRWDPVWPDPNDVPEKQVHVWVSLSSQVNADGAPVEALAERTGWLKSVAARSGGVTLLAGHRGMHAEFQDSSAIMLETPEGRRIPTATEHFGFTDGIADPTFAGQYEAAVEAVEVIGGGKLQAGEPRWTPLATGEFMLGHVNEAQELPPSAQPWSFMRNGTFMAWRKLHQNVASFDAYAAQQAVLFRQVAGLAGDDEARETILAKMVGRWRSGIPLEIAPTYAEAKAVEAQWADIPALQLKSGSRTPAEAARLAAYEKLITDFCYKDDVGGARCPVSAHIRRANPRDALDPNFGTAGEVPDSTLTNRRRLMRRGLPYGESGLRDDAGEHGVIFMALCASLFDQFEFVQQQWMQYGSSFNVGNDTDPVVGLHRAGAKFVVPADPNRSGLPFICANIPQFVETRGGEYFFLPSLTALREIAQGSVDPT